MSEEPIESRKETEITTEDNQITESLNEPIEEDKDNFIKKEDIKTEEFNKEDIKDIKNEKEEIKKDNKKEIEIEKEEISTSKKPEKNSSQLINEIPPSNSNNLYLNNDFIPEQEYDILLDDNGNPNLNENSIFVIDNNSELNIKIMNNIKISNELNLVSNCYKEFPSLNFEEELKPFIKVEKKNIDITNSIDDEIELPLKKINDYRIEPEKVNIMIYFRIQFLKSGIYTFYLLYREKDTRKLKLTNPFKILVNPVINLGINEKTNEQIKISTNKIQLQSVLTKNLGKLNNFENYFHEANLLKYNFIHFTSIQELSSSDNLFSLKNHNEISNSYFDKKNLTQIQKVNLFKEQMENLRKKYHIGSCIDIILNQTSIESTFIYEHPECGVTLDNYPWLTAAYELDKLLVNYSNLFYEKKVGCQCAPYINNENDLDDAIEEIKKKIWRENLEEYFLIEIEDCITKFQEFYQNLDKDQAYAMKRSYLFNELENNFGIRVNSKGRLILNEDNLYDLISHSCNNFGEKKFGVKIETEFVAMLILETTRDKKTNTYINEFNFLKEVKKYINKINEEWTLRTKEMLQIAILNVKEFIRYEFIQLRRTGVRRKLIDNYFHVIDPNDKKKIFLCNGFIMQSEDEKNPFPDITKYGTYYLFKRKVVVWNDSLKLNYGYSIEKSPKFLLDYMTNYLTDMAKIFDGFYIDNIISIPNHALKYLLNIAREINPNLVLITELPENNLEKEVSYVNNLGINLFAKEMIWCTTPKEISNNISEYGHGREKIKTKFNKEKFRNKNNENNSKFRDLKCQKPNSILFDLSLDNQSYFEQYNNLSMNLSMMACIGLLDCAVGSTRGYDQLFPFQPSVVKENRNYIYDNHFEDLINEIKKNMQSKEQTKEIFFEFHPRNSENPNTKHVKLALSSHNWRPDINLTRINDNLFTVRLKLPKGKYHYKYVLDGNIWTYDASQPMEFDIKKQINNVLDLCDDTKLIVNDIKLLRRDINTIREKLKDVKSEVYVHTDQDLISIIRMVCDGKKVRMSLEESGAVGIYDTGEKNYGEDNNSEISSSIRENGSRKNNNLTNNFGSNNNLNINQQFGGFNFGNNNFNRFITSPQSNQFNQQMNNNQFNQQMNNQFNQQMNNNQFNQPMNNNQFNLPMNNNQFNQQMNNQFNQPMNNNQFNQPMNNNQFNQQMNNNQFNQQMNNNQFNQPMNNNQFNQQMNNNQNLNNPYMNNYNQMNPSLNSRTSSSKNVSQSNNPHNPINLLSNFQNQVPNPYIKNQNKNKKNYYNEYVEQIIYEGYAVICRPGYDKDHGESINSRIVLPGEISDFICGCYMNVEDFELNNFLSDSVLTGARGNVYYSKDSNFLSSISSVSFENGNTIIDFHSILPNTVILLKLSSRTEIDNFN